MKLRELGKSSINASVIGFGSWAAGGWMWGNSDEKQVIDAVHASIEYGLNLIDTAPAYGFGLSESIIGKAIEGRRDKVVLATKCGLEPSHKGKPFFRTNSIGQDPNGLIQINIYQGADSIREELEYSLKRLNTDYIDLYQTHWQDPTTPIEETMNTLLKLKKEGKIRAIGVSNASTDQMNEYMKYGPLDSDQENYSMLDRDAESKQLPYCIKNNVAFLAYSPLAFGLLTGKMGPERQFEKGDLRIGNPRFSVEYRKKISAFLEQINPIATKYNASIAQIVIAWTFSQPGVSHVLCGARNVEQAVNNAKAGSIELNKEEVTQITDLIKTL